MVWQVVPGISVVVVAGVPGAAPGIGVVRVSVAVIMVVGVPVAIIMVVLGVSVLISTLVVIVTVTTLVVMVTEVLGRYLTCSSTDWELC